MIRYLTRYRESMILFLSLAAALTSLEAIGAQQQIRVPYAWQAKSRVNVPEAIEQPPRAIGKAVPHESAPPQLPSSIARPDETCSDNASQVAELQIVIKSIESRPIAAKSRTEPKMPDSSQPNSRRSRMEKLSGFSTRFADSAQVSDSTRISDAKSGPKIVKESHSITDSQSAHSYSLTDSDSMETSPAVFPGDTEAETNFDAEGETLSDERVDNEEWDGQGTEDTPATEETGGVQKDETDDPMESDFADHHDSELVENRMDDDSEVESLESLDSDVGEREPKRIEDIPDARPVPISEPQQSNRRPLSRWIAILGIHKTAL